MLQLQLILGWVHIKSAMVTFFIVIFMDRVLHKQRDHRGPCRWLCASHGLSCHKTIAMVFMLLMIDCSFLIFLLPLGAVVPILVLKARDSVLLFASYFSESQIERVATCHASQ